MGKTEIQWCDFSFNPWVGCQRVSPGCEHCYAESYDKRVGGAVIDKATGEKALRWGPKAPRVRTSPANWKKPIAWNKAALEVGERHRVFCSSLADVFERLAPGQVGDLDSWRLELFDLISKTPQLDWLLLTKRPQLIERGLSGAVDAWERTAGCEPGMELAQRWMNGTPPPNVWLGTTVEDQQRANERIPELVKIPAKVHFLSCEPLLERVDVSRWIWPVCESWKSPYRSAAEARAAGGEVQRKPQSLVSSAWAAQMVNWVIVGGESGGKARTFHLEWARSLVQQCADSKTAAFVKQMGSAPHCDGDRVRLVDHHGGDMAEWPEDLRVREFPS